LRTKTPHTADRILDAAAQLFSCQRFHEVRMDTIATEAEVSKGTLYSYFQDKDELYRALLARASTGMIEALENAAHQHEDARAKLIAIVDAVLTYFDEEPHLFDLIQRVEVLSQNEVEFPWQQARDVAARLVHGVFEQGRLAGEFQVTDPETSVWLLFGGLRSVIRFARRPLRPRMAEFIVDAFLHGAASGA
jgi:AcrR family transcriptional regulator